MSHSMPWYPHATVAAIIERDGKYLMVHEHTDSGKKINQPAGHLEKNETLIEAVIRETKEETGWNVQPEGIVRINQYLAPANNTTYLRITFFAKALSLDVNAILDTEIIEALWLTKNDIIEQKNTLRSPLVLSDITFFEQNPVLPLSYFNNL